MILFLLIAVTASLIFVVSKALPTKEDKTSLYRIPTTPCSVYRPLTDVLPIFQAWYQAILKTKRELWFSTYVWHVHQVKDHGFITPHIYYMGLALKELDESLSSPVQAHFLINHSVWMMKNRYIQDCWQQTWSLWKELGFQGKKVQVSFYVWKHYSLNNIHGKVLLIDDEEAVMTSINVEQESYGGPNSWYESGAWVTDKKATDVLKSFLKPYIERSTKLDLPEIVKVPGKRGGLTRQGEPVTIKTLKESLPSFHNTLLKTLTDEATFKAIDYKESKITKEILDLVKSAKYSIHIMSPSFNLYPLWDTLVKQCEKHDTLSVKIITGWNFNESHPRTQKYLLNYPVNSDFIQGKTSHLQIQWRWYANDGVKAHRHGGAMCHAKMILVDNQRGKCSSFNLDTWSSQYSMETAFFFESIDVANHYNQYLFQPRWEQGENI